MNKNNYQIIVDYRVMVLVIILYITMHFPIAGIYLAAILLYVLYGYYVKKLHDRSGDNTYNTSKFGRFATWTFPWLLHFVFIILAVFDEFNTRPIYKLALEDLKYPVDNRYYTLHSFITFHKISEIKEEESKYVGPRNQPYDLTTH